MTALARKLRLMVFEVGLGWPLMLTKQESRCKSQVLPGFLVHCRSLQGRDARRTRFATLPAL